MYFTTKKAVFFEKFAAQMMVATDLLNIWKALKIGRDQGISEGIIQPCKCPVCAGVMLPLSSNFLG
jgi:hypothetical protein